MRTMIYMIYILIAVLFVSAFSGCGSCIRIGGAYKDYSGEVEYCFSEKSEPGAPVVVETAGEEKAEYFGVTEDEIDAIVGALGVVSSSSRTSTRSPHERLRAAISAKSEGR